MTSASRLRRSSGPAAPPVAPTRPQASICHGVQGPCPRKPFESSAASPPTAAPARGPSATPAQAVIVVTGWTFGIAANSTRPAAAAAP